MVLRASPAAFAAAFGVSFGVFERAGETCRSYAEPIMLSARDCTGCAGGDRARGRPGRTHLFPAWARGPAGTGADARDAGGGLQLLRRSATAAGSASRSSASQAVLAEDDLAAYAAAMGCAVPHVEVVRICDPGARAMRQQTTTMAGLTAMLEVLGALAPRGAAHRLPYGGSPSVAASRRCSPRCTAAEAPAHHLPGLGRCRGILERAGGARDRRHPARGRGARHHGLAPRRATAVACARAWQRPRRVQLRPRAHMCSPAGQPRSSPVRGVGASRSGTRGRRCGGRRRVSALAAFRRGTASRPPCRCGPIGRGAVCPTSPHTRRANPACCAESTAADYACGGTALAAALWAALLARVHQDDGRAHAPRVGWWRRRCTGWRNPGLLNAPAMGGNERRVTSADTSRDSAGTLAPALARRTGWRCSTRCCATPTAVLGALRGQAEARARPDLAARPGAGSWRDATARCGRSGTVSDRCGLRPLFRATPARLGGGAGRLRLRAGGRVATASPGPPDGDKGVILDSLRRFTSWQCACWPRRGDRRGGRTGRCGWRRIR